jgi:hypothetical protein
MEGLTERYSSCQTLPSSFTTSIDREMPAMG